MQSTGTSVNDLVFITGMTTPLVQQYVDDPRRLPMAVLAQLAAAMGCRVSVMLYPNVETPDGPVHPEIFLKFWQAAGRPKTVFDLEEGGTG